MNFNDKIETLFFMVTNCFCSWEMFIENVRSQDGEKLFKSKLKNCSTEEEIESLMNEYI